MNSYTITISSDSGDAETTVAVDSSDGFQRVTEIAIKAPSGAGVSAQQLRAIDLDLLLRALSPLGTIPAEPAGPTRPQRPTRQPGTPKAAVSGTAADDAAGNGSAAAERRRTRRKGGAATKAAGDGVDVSTARAYRRMPDDVAEVYAAEGSVTAVAAHYGVPRHTAQGWIGRLRRRD